jgi:hypothetical protein
MCIIIQIQLAAAVKLFNNPIEQHFLERLGPEDQVDIF